MLMAVKKVTDLKEFRCVSHGIKPIAMENFYRANEGSIYGHLGCIPICKTCLKKKYNAYLEQYTGDVKFALYNTLRKIDVIFSLDVFHSAMNEAKGKKERVLGIYMKNLNSLPQYKNSVWSFDESEPLEIIKPEEKKSVDEEVSERMNSVKLNERDLQNMNDIIKMVGFDPFSGYTQYDRKFLYEALLPQLDEDIVEDQTALDLILQVLNNSHQIRKIDLYLNTLYKDMTEYQANMSLVGSLTNQKKNIAGINKEMLKNDIFSDKSRNKKSSLGKVMKYLRELGFEEAEESIFDQLTTKATMDVLDMSHQSIIKQVEWDEVDRAEMFREQRDLIEQLENEKSKMKIELVELHRKIKLLEGDSDV